MSKRGFFLVCSRRLGILLLGSLVFLTMGDLTPEDGDGEGATPTAVDLRLHHGVIFRPIGEAVITGSDWTACTSIDLGTYKRTFLLLKGHLTTIETALDQLERVAVQKSRSDESGDATRSQLFTSIGETWQKLTVSIAAELSNYNDSLTEFFISAGTLENDRARRGLINIVSDAGKFLFGFSTEKEVTQLKEKINVLSSQTGQLTHMADQQISYVKGVAEQVLTNGQHITSLEESVQKIGTTVTDLIANTGSVKLSLLFTGMGIEIVTSFLLIRKELDQAWNNLHTIRRILRDAGDGRQPLDLYSGKTFRQILTDLEEHLPSTWSLLYDTNSHFDYLQYIQASAYTDDEKVHICSSIPIIETSSRYNVYEAVSMPVVHPSFPEKVYFSYKFDVKYLAVSVNTYQNEPDRAYFTLGDDFKTYCQGGDPMVCPLSQAIKLTSSEKGLDSCLFSLFTEKAAPSSCPIQVEYQDGPIFRNLGRGVWVYGAASGDLVVKCSNKGVTQGTFKKYRLTGTGAFRMQPGCDASFGNVRLPGYVHGQGQILADLPEVPVVDAFSLNLTLSLFTQIVSELPEPKNFDDFLSHLINNTSIKQRSIQLREFNRTIAQYDTLRNQLSEYHPYRWIGLPQSQVTGLILLFLLNVVTTGLTWIWIRRLRRQGILPGAPTTGPNPDEASHPLVRLRRRRRRQTASEATV